MHKYQTLIDAIEAGPTQGPWKWDGDVCNYNPREEAPWIIAGQLDEIAVLTGEIRCAKKADADFIVAACNSARSLLEDNERLRELLFKVKGVIESSDEWWMDCPDRGGFDLDEINSVLSITGAKP